MRNQKNPAKNRKKLLTDYIAFANIIITQKKMRVEMFP
jgi:hypothetical protein